jgi:hypothetical protein
MPRIRSTPHAPQIIAAGQIPLCRRRPYPPPRHLQGLYAAAYKVSAAPPGGHSRRCSEDNRSAACRPRTLPPRSRSHHRLDGGQEDPCVTRFTQQLPQPGSAVISAASSPYSHCRYFLLGAQLHRGTVAATTTQLLSAGSTRNQRRRPSSLLAALAPAPASFFPAPCILAWPTWLTKPHVSSIAGAPERSPS